MGAQHWVRKRLWDISPPIDELSPVFPGDTVYRRLWGARIDAGAPVNVSALTLSPHVGAHADAPLHYDSRGVGMDRVALEPYLGHCRVIHALHAGAFIQPMHLEHAGLELPPRILVRTYARFPLHRFDPQLTAFAPAALEWLAEQDVRLVGTDAASVDPADSKTLDAHRVLYERDMRVLENLRLDQVPEGDYELIALPLNLVGADASPVRAVLREL